ncbi:MAG: hypothetical protein J0I29_12410 [Rhizobiales bacterium]|nr:hypothetical protein [Hyphomicrobiales bacterium]
MTSKLKFFVLENEIPSEAMASFPDNVMIWRLGVVNFFAEHSAVIRVAWLLEGLMFRAGYSWVTDPTLAEYMGVGTEAIQKALKKLSDGGAIIRVHVQRKGRTLRYIFPSRNIAAHAPATVMGPGTRDDGGATLRTRRRKLPRDRSEKNTASMTGHYANYDKGPSTTAPCYADQMQDENSDTYVPDFMRDDWPF